VARRAILNGVTPPQDALTRADELRRLIAHHDRRYHVDDRP
jgi:hypothetical protein